MTTAKNPESGDPEKYCERNNEGNLSGSYEKNRGGSMNREDGERI